jgi:hypothetical protein
MNGVGSSHMVKEGYAQAKMEMNMLATSKDEDCKI